MKNLCFLLLCFSVLLPALLFPQSGIPAQNNPAETATMDFVSRRQLGILKKVITKNLPREIDVGNMDTFLFGLQGAWINNFIMTENAEFLKSHHCINPVFMKADSILVRINPLMLLLGQVYINEMQINSPRFQVIHDAEGNFNFDDLSEAQDSKLLKWLRIKGLSAYNGAYLVFDDGALDSPVTYTVNKVDVRISDFTIDKVFNLDIRAASPGSAVQNMFLHGKAGPMELNQKNEQIPVNADLTVVGLPILPYLGYTFPKDSPAKPVSGLIDINFHLNGDAWSGMTMTGDLGLSGVVFQSADGALSGEPLNTKMILKEPITLSYRDDLLQMGALDLIINGNRFSLSGELTNLKGLSRADLRLTTGDLDIGVVKAAYPFLLEALPPQADFSGLFGMNVRLTGNQLDATLTGGMDLTGMTFTFADYFYKPGQAPMKMDFSARVNTRELMAATGRFEMGNFELGHYNFIEDVLMRLLANATDQAAKEKLLARYRQLPQTMEKISGNVSYKDNRARVTDINIINLRPEPAPGLDAVLDGVVNFSDNTLDMKGDIIISKELSRAVIAIAPENAAYLCEGSIVIGFQHTGTIDNFSLEIFPRAIRLPAAKTP
jgi:hypothetical protein